MSIRHATLSPGRANLVLATLFLGAFGMGSADLLVVGVLDLIAADLQISIPAAGALVTAYALGLAIGGALAQSLPASAGIAFGSVAGGVAIDGFTHSAAVLTGLVIAVVSIPVAWATSFLKPPVVEHVAGPEAAESIPKTA